MRRALRSTAAGAGRAWRRFQPVSLTVVGFGLIVASVWHGAGTTAGLAAAGGAALLLEWRVKH